MRRLPNSVFAFFLLACLTLPASPAAAQKEISFVEDYALATDREKALESLVPGTEDYYYYHCLHYQTTEQLDRVDETLKSWEKKRGKTAFWKTIQNRQALLKYSSNPEQTLEYIRDELNLRFDHQQVIPPAEQKLPSILDPKLISIDTLMASAMQRSNTDRIEQSGLELLANRKLSKNQRRHLLKRIDYPDFPNLVELIHVELQEKDSQGFGNLRVHQLLTLKQLEELSKKRPALLTNTGFVNIYISKLAPSDDVNWKSDNVEHQAYLDRLWDFVKDLPANFNSLKACILYRHLTLHQKRNEYADAKAKFTQYIQLPRRVGYVNPKWIKQFRNNSHIVNMGANYSGVIQLIPIINDEPLVRDYLHQYLLDADTSAEFDTYFESKYLKQQFATVKILNGIGDKERWAAMLTPSQYQALIDRVDLQFASDSPEHFDVDASVELELYTKNVKNLIVKIFEINTFNYYRKNQSEIDTDIVLDGMVPNHELTFKYDDAPALRKLRKFKLDQLDGRGVYIVDFIGGGTSSRALIRKGRLQMIGNTTFAGHRFHVVDEKGTPIPDASLWISGRQYTAADTKSKDGLITVPYTAMPGRAAAILTHDGFSSLQTFQHKAENYNFQAAIYVDRESLVRSGTAKVLVRPRLTVANSPISATNVSNVSLQINSVNLDNVASTKVLNDLKMQDDSEWIFEFVVPPRLKTIQFSVSGEIENINGGKQVVSASQSFNVNSIDASDQIVDAHLLPTNQGYFLEVLGKSGERRSKHNVPVEIKIRHFARTVKTTLQSDENGMIKLGELKNVQWITANGGRVRRWNLNSPNQTYYRTIHINEGDTVEVPSPVDLQELSPNRVSLLELRNGKIVTDKFDLIGLDKGVLKVVGLAPGDYRMRLKQQNRSISIRVTKNLASTKPARILVGRDRHLQRRGNRTVFVKDIKSNNDAITVKLGNATAMSRVHVFATRYQPAFQSWDFFAQIPTIEPWMYRPPVRRSVYMAGRTIGDEYQYILDRKYKKKFPGNMLDRPSLLNNPWAARVTSNQIEQLAGGDQFGNVGADADGKDAQAKGEKVAADGYTCTANLDFLGSGVPVLDNLRPDENGEISIDREALGNAQHIRIVVTSSSSTIQRTVNLPLMKMEPRDSRLADTMDSEKHFTQTKQTEFLSEGDKLKIDDIVTARFKYYDDLGDIYRFFAATNPNAFFKKFNFILLWPELEQEEKQKYYSKFACHELNFYLFKKDPKFFESVVLKHLEQKRERTFMDRWLLNENLEEYLKPWKFQDLNTVERILLSRRLEDQGAEIVRHIQDLYRISPTPRAISDRLYETAIASREFGSSGIATWEQQRSKLSEQTKGNMLPDLRDSLSAALKPGSQSASAYIAGDAPGLAGGGGGMSISGGALFRSGNGVVSPSTQPSEMAGETASLGLAANKAIAEKKMDSLQRGGRASSSGRAKKMQPNVDGNSSMQGRYETRTRTVPVTRSRAETRTRQVPVTRNGKTEMVAQNYTVNVPYTEQVTQQYQVFVPSGSDTDDDGIMSGIEADEALLDDEFSFEAENQGEVRKALRRFYSKLKPTQEWLENNYYHLLPEQQTSQLVTPNQFWQDFAMHKNGPFVSANFVEAHRNFTEMMFALAVIDLPTNGPEHEFDYADRSMTLTTKGPMIAFHQQVRNTVFDQQNTTILVSENFFQKNDRFRYEEGIRFDKFISDEFLANNLYGAQVVITNPTSTPRMIDLLVQIPKGSVACSGSQETRTIQMELGAFSTQTMEYFFYFPVAGEFTHYPAHVSSNEKVLAVAGPVDFTVVDRPAELDKASWEYVSQNGSNDQVIDYVNQENVLRLDLTKIAFRLSDKAFYKDVLETLRNRYRYDHTVWSYSVKHNDTEAIREYLMHSPFVSTCGFYFQSPLLDLIPFELDWYQHREYSPLINARAHQVGQRRTILNPQFYSQYHKLLGYLAGRRKLADDDHLVVTYYLLLQDRVEEAMEHFEQVDVAKLDTKLQYDYCDAYLDFYRENPDAAASKAERWANYPVNHWRYRFNSLLAQVNEIRGGKTEALDDEDAKQKENRQDDTELAASSPTFDFEVESGKAKLKFQNLKEVTVNIYEMDIELLFSRNPFAEENLDGFTMIRPNSSQTVKLPPRKKTHDIKLPKEFQNKNVLVEIVAGDQTKSRAYYANSLTVQVSENYGQLRVTDAAGKKGMAKTYVKVYAQTANGNVRFHKDGYSDLRGRFDYVTQSNNPVDDVAKYSVLILHPEFGAIVRQVTPPQR